MRRILIAETEADNRILMTDALAALGYEIVGEAATVEDAIIQARNLRPDVILLNIEGEDRQLLTSAERIQAALPEIAIMFVTDAIFPGDG